MKHLKGIWFPLGIWTTYLMATVTSFQRPFYNIAHMVNSIEEIDHYLSLGANGLEVDITFAPNGTAISVFHGLPCDCFRVCRKTEDIGKYFEYLKELTTPGNPNYRPQLIFLILDLKVAKLDQASKLAAGRSITNKLIKHLWEGGRGKSVLRILASIVHVQDSDVIVGIQQTLKEKGLNHLIKKIGWDVSMNDPLGEIEALYVKLGTKKHWQSDGKTNCLASRNLFSGSLGRLRSAIKIRDTEDSYIAKVYHWTIDLRPLMKQSLSYGVDGILTNHPERVIEALSGPEFRDIYRLATVDDDPWEKIMDPQREGNIPQASVSRLGRAMMILMDVVNSIRKYLSQVFG